MLGGSRCARLLCSGGADACEQACRIDGYQGWEMRDKHWQTLEGNSRLHKSGGIRTTVGHPDSLLIMRRVLTDRENTRFCFSGELWSCDESHPLTLTFLKMILHNWAIVSLKRRPGEDWCRPLDRIISKNWHFSKRLLMVFVSLLLGTTSGCYATAADGRGRWSCAAFCLSQVTFHADSLQTCS